LSIHVGRRKSELSSKGLVQDDVFEMDTWPYEPSGTLKKALTGRSMPTEEIMKTQGQEYEQLNEFVHQFSEKQKTSISWVLAAAIGVLGNLAVTLGFGPWTNGGNIVLMSVVLFVILVLILAFFFFLPRVTILFRFIGPYVSFPQGYEERIREAKYSNPLSEIMLAYNNLSETVTNYGSLVRTAILRKHLQPALLKSSSIKISDIRDIGGNLSFYFIELSTKGIKTWLNPRGKELIQNELRSVVDALMQARLMCSVYSFELDYHEWIEKGPGFVDAVSSWDFAEIQRSLVHQMLSN
jgi:hypothetical protein